jgi:periplasmic copper chaperone A
MKIRFFGISILMIILAACRPAPDVSVNGIEVYKPVATAAKTGEVAGAFMTIKNTAAEADYLLGATCDAADMTQVHETVMDGDVMKMNEVESLEIPAGQMVELKHGSYHIMLMGLKRDLADGQTLTITLKFEKAGDVPVTMTVKKP